MNEETVLSQILSHISADFQQQHKDYFQCLLFREQFYSLQRLLLRVAYKVCSDTIYYEDEDPSNLLTLIINNTNYCSSLHQTAIRVRILRNYCYGHVRTLKIDDELIQHLENIMYIYGFYSIIDYICELSYYLSEYLQNQS